MLIDSHCHLDAREFEADRALVIQAAIDLDVGVMVVPAVDKANFETVITLAEQYPNCVYALGIHPMYINHSTIDHLHDLAALVEIRMSSDKPPVAIGEIGLDFFAEGFDREKQEYFFSEQLKLAKKFDLPVILHVRRSVDDVLKFLRRMKLTGGIAHAFNGSSQQANEFIKLGFKLGFGGAMTYSRALNIRQLASSLPLQAIVLETDSPDIPPEWLGNRGRNSPAELPKIAQVLADLRAVELSEIVLQTRLNAIQALPKIAQLCTPPQVLL